MGTDPSAIDDRGMTTFDHEDEPQARWAPPIEGSAASHWPDLPIAPPGGAPEHPTATKTPTTSSRRGRAGVIVTGLLIAMFASTVALGSLSVHASMTARHDRQAARTATRTRADLAARGHAAGVERN